MFPQFVKILLPVQLSLFVPILFLFTPRLHPRSVLVLVLHFAVTRNTRLARPLLPTWFMVGPAAGPDKTLIKLSRFQRFSPHWFWMDLNCLLGRSVSAGSPGRLPTAEQAQGGWKVHLVQDTSRPHSAKRQRPSRHLFIFPTSYINRYVCYGYEWIWVIYLMEKKYKFIFH